MEETMKSKPIVVITVTLIAAFLALGIISCGDAGSAAQVQGKNIIVQFDKMMNSRVLANFDGGKIQLGEYQPTEFVTIGGQDIQNFTMNSNTEKKLSADEGAGSVVTLTGNAGDLEKKVEVTVYDEFPDMAFYRVIYTNNGQTPVQVDRWVNNRYNISAQPGIAEQPVFWSFQSGSYEKRPDWVLPLKEGFKQRNYMGMNASDYGGGTPVVDVWRRDAGIGVGHVEMVPKLVSLPVNMPSANQADLGVEFQVDKELQPGESLETFRTFVDVHKGDYFKTLEEYRKFMVKQGVHFDETPETAYEPIWCAWGFRRDFTIDQIYKALPEVKKMGYKWAVLDDGWQTAEGDWYLVKSKFPRGDADMKKLVDTIHSYGLKAKLWWTPLAVDPGTDLIKQHPEYLLKNKDGSNQHISWWDSWYLCPAYPPVQEFTRKQVEKFIGEWGYDGLKIDGQHLNAAPPCYNPEHHHQYPEEAFEKVPEFFKTIYDEARKIKPDAVIEICPCGTAYSFFTMPFMNQSVASDPTSSWQVRLKGKTFKALMGSSAPYYGDHVELSDGHDDFASSVGVGAVIGTKFTWPVGSSPKSRVDLTPEKEQVWQKWLDIYDANMLPTGEYLGTLYDIGFDRPETHAVKKDDKMYYAFFAGTYNGAVELRGLGSGSYRVLDYENGKEYGSVNGPVANVPVDFANHLLLVAIPE
jgi:alpha-galactosidase